MLNKVIRFNLILLALSALIFGQFRNDSLTKNLLFGSPFVLVGNPFDSLFFSNIDSCSIEIAFKNSISESKANSLKYYSAKLIDDVTFWEILFFENVNQIYVEDTHGLNSIIGCIINLIIYVDIKSNNIAYKFAFSPAIGFDEGRIIYKNKLYKIRFKAKFSNAIKQYFNDIITKSIPSILECN